MTELEAKRILGSELAESWLRMPETSRAALRPLLTEPELRAVAVLEGHPLPDPPPQADLDRVLKLPRPVQRPVSEEIPVSVLPAVDLSAMLALHKQVACAAAPEPDSEVTAAVLPAADFSHLCAPAPPPSRAAIEPPRPALPSRRLPEPDFSLLNSWPNSYRPRRYRPVRRAGSRSANSCCLWAVAVYLFALYVFLNYVL